jgi:hypothetical protein
MAITKNAQKNQIFLPLISLTKNLLTRDYGQLNRGKNVDKYAGLARHHAFAAPVVMLLTGDRVSCRP